VSISSRWFVVVRAVVLVDIRYPIVKPGIFANAVIRRSQGN
jgi:hypothetical protein